MNRIEILAIVEIVQLKVIAYNEDLTKEIGRPIAVLLIDARSGFILRSAVNLPTNNKSGLLLAKQLIGPLMRTSEIKRFTSRHPDNLRLIVDRSVEFSDKEFCKAMGALGVSLAVNISHQSVTERVTHKVLHRMGEFSSYKLSQSDLDEQYQVLIRYSLADIAQQLSMEIRAHNNTLDSRLDCTPRKAWKRHIATV